MPYPNEHALRLRNPDDFAKDTFRRTKGSGKGKVKGVKIPNSISVIWGKLKGKASSSDPVVPQALRFPIASWGKEPSKAKNWIKDHGITGSFEKAAPKDNEERDTLVDAEELLMETVEHFRVNLDAKDYRYEDWMGKNHLVVPGIILVEGVHNGFMYSSDEIETGARYWNGVPVPIYHPQDCDGNPISAQSPEVVSQCVGRFWNAHYDDGIKGVKGEFWLDVSMLDSLVVEELLNGKMEVSTGLWADHMYGEGKWQGEEYEAELANFVPDHIALLPGKVGACNWEDGCGIRVNTVDPYKNKTKQVKNNGREVTTTLEKNKNSSEEGTVKGFIKLIAEKLGLKVQEASHEDVRRNLTMMLREKLSSGDPQEMPDVWLREVFDKYFVYENGNDMFKQAYTLDANDQVEFSGDPIKVKVETRYMPIVENEESETTDIDTNENNNESDGEAEDGETGTPAIEDNEDGGQTNEEEDVTMEKKDKVSAIINSGMFQEEDREYLTALSDERLDKLATFKAPVENEGDSPDDNVEDQEDTEATVAVAPVSAESYLQNDQMPEEVRGVLKEGLRMHRAERTRLIKNIIANKKNVFTKEQLEKKDMDELRGLSALAAGDEEEGTDFTLNAGGVYGNDLAENERQEDGNGVPTSPTMKWNADGTPNFAEVA